MALPAGITTATVTVGVPVTFSGLPVRTSITITPSAFLVHTATGHPLVNMIEEASASDGVAVQFTLPHTDQNGFQDEAGNAYKNWYYTATIQYQTDKATKAPFTKVFQLATGQTLVDLDLLPSGNAAMPYSAPLPTVSSVNGQTGAVTVPTTSDSDVAAFVQGSGPTATALNATILDQIKTETSALNPVSDLPTFVRANGGNPVFTLATQNPAPDALAPTTAASLYWPWIISAVEFAVPSRLDEYYMFYSTDHGAGGIWLATGPTPLGPWTGRGQVYNDIAGGEQTETPTVFRNPFWGVVGQKRYIMLYQQGTVPGAVGAQSTLYAESDDLITWTRGAIALDITPAVQGDGHTGYATVALVGRQLFSHHLRGGSDNASFGLSTSNDGKKWGFVGWLGWGRDQLGDGRRIEWNYTSLIRWRGQLLWVGMLSQVVSGVTPNDARIGVAPITPDLRNLVGQPEYQLYPTVGAETTSYRCVRAFQFDGTVYLYYQVGNSFYAAIAEA